MNVKIQKWGIIMKLNEGRTPDSDSYHMPAEYEKHSGCIMIWPKREGSFPFGCEPARKAFCSIVLAIAQSERVHILVDDEQMLESVAGRREFSDTGILKGNESYDLRAAAGGRLNNTGITIDIIRSDDAWARDTAPTFVVNNNCKKNNDLFGHSRYYRTTKY
jgi:agmatine deiminase